MSNFFVTAIGTDSGKTIVSAILCEALGARYWKPVQAGYPRDTETVASLVSNPFFKSFPERYLLNTPASPHAAAKIDGVTIKVSDFVLPSKEQLVIEGAGGCMVPLNDDEFVIDLAGKIPCEVIVVSNLYLGSINHTLLTVSLLKNKNLPVKGIIFNGPRNEESERIILHHSGWPCLLRIENEKSIDRAMVLRYAEEIKRNLS
ncbi:MAG TPA: dethiobiotin synthase [Cyclobacteriaceae bacterium]|nr:dethiobiotin synthase [Cyclobacteriaceae bacterium]